MKKLFLLIVLSLIVTNIFSQRDLWLQDNSISNAVFAEARKACVTITSPLDQDLKPLFFEDSKIRKPEKTDTIGNDINYHFVFNVSQGNNAKKLIIKVSGFNPHPLELFLQPNEQLNYMISDPDNMLVKCYYQLTKEAKNLFLKTQYEDAQKKYIAAKDCSDAKDDKERIKDLNNQIAQIDSILYWKKQGDLYTKLEVYNKSVEYYNNILNLNPDDVQIIDRKNNAINRLQGKCEEYYKNAERAYTDHNWREAQKKYNAIVQLDCASHLVAAAKVKLIDVEDKLGDIENKQLPHVLTYEFSENTPIGISTGNYKNNKASGYFTLRLNSDLFEALRSNIIDDSKPEVNVSFGWTIRIVKKYAWIFFGPGYTGVGEYVYNENDIDKVDDPKLKIYSAVSPEIGILGKIPLGQNIGISLRYTFQYRYAIEKETADYIGKTRSVFGVGFCF